MSSSTGNWAAFNLVRRTLFPIVLASLLLVLLAACSGGDDEEYDEDGIEATATSAPSVISTPDSPRDDGTLAVPTTQPTTSGADPTATASAAPPPATTGTAKPSPTDTEPDAPTTTTPDTATPLPPAAGSTATVTTSSGAAGSESGTGSGQTVTASEIEIFPFLDIIFTDLKTGLEAFDVEIEGEFGESPTAFMTSNEGETDFLGLLRSNLDWLKAQGYGSIEMPMVSGYGDVMFDSAVLSPLRHEGVDYNSQYENSNPEKDLRIDEEAALTRYRMLSGLAEVVIREASERGIAVAGNVEALAHIINRAAGAGIGGGESELLISGNLPAPSIEQVLQFIDEVIALGVVRISAEAYPEDYDLAITNHLATVGVPYKHTGAGLGDLWTGYYYSPYPDSALMGQAYNYLHTADAMFGATNGSIFARARAEGDAIDTVIVVGAYLPIPCDTSRSVAELFNDDGSGQRSIDNEIPTYSDGSVADNCSTAMWSNLLLMGAARQGVRILEVTADVTPSIAAVATPGLGTQILNKILAHPVPDQTLPIANVIFDTPGFTDEDGISNAEFWESVRDVQIGLIDDALQAAGYQTVLTFDAPWTAGEVALTYILTAGGNEETADGEGLGPPYWNSYQDIDPALQDLLDPTKNPTPVFIHPIYGVPEIGAWASLRQSMGLPARFEYQNPVLSIDGEYMTSLLTSWMLDSEAEATGIGEASPITPTVGQILGASVRLTPYGDVSGIGQTANYANLASVPDANVVVSGPLMVPGSGGVSEVSAPYIVTDGNGRYLWLVSHLHHEGFSFAMSQAIAEATGSQRVLAQPAAVHLYTGKQTFAFAYEATNVSLNLPFTSGDLIDITVYDISGTEIRSDLGVPYSGPFGASLDKYSLLVVEPARR
ncbi:MAG: hypothetical protein HQ478_15670 [Chloroflexi bacterium]|nr:hypothetical protein [Chloroflexota bacterium]